MTKYSYEEEILNFWKQHNVYEKVQKQNVKGEAFNHIDGPPYPTGEPHMGHLRNWAIKDATLRIKRFQGRNVYARDGYDVHGLPVETKVQNKFNLKTVDDLKQYGEGKFVEECKKYVDTIIDSMGKIRDQYGLWMDRKPYLTSHPQYLSMAWQFFKKANEKGLLYKDYKTVAWCPHDETTLSDYEIKDTYTTLEDPSIYVRFKVQKEFQSTEYEESLLIWTTTPWTLQSNMAVAVNPNEKYAKVLVNRNRNEEILIIAESLVEKVLETLSKSQDIDFIKIVETKTGKQLEGTKYEHFYINETPSQQEFLKQNIKYLHSVVCADYVTLGEGEDVLDKLEKKGYKHSIGTKVEEKKEEKPQVGKTEGTGLVHIAPGHGFEDFNVGRTYKLPIFCPVGVNGCFTEGKYKGQYFKDVDPFAIAYLKDKDAILHAGRKKHRYPCCWRCKTPIVYRAADQWWIKRSELIKEISEANSKDVNWTPESAKELFNQLMSTSGDWAISRQRFWGIPLPIFEDEDGNYEVFGSKEELEKRVGKQLLDIHRDNLKDLVIMNTKSKKPMKAVPFIADVWFDSGCASFASHYEEGLSFDQIIERYYPMHWVTEGEDQVRGWFSSLFNVGYMVTKKAPYKNVLFYRFVMDETGKQKMSKSLGNGVGGPEALELWGADRTRYYLLTKNAPDDQINFNKKDFEGLESVFTTLENTFKFMNNYVIAQQPKIKSLNPSELNLEDAWILAQAEKAYALFLQHCEKFEYQIAYKYVEDLLIRDISKTYLKIVKERTEDDDEQLAIVFAQLLNTLVLMFAPVAPFKAEQLYQVLEKQGKKESLFLERFPQASTKVLEYAESKGITQNFEKAQELVQAILNIREKIKTGVRWPLSKAILSTTHEQKDLAVFSGMVCKLTNVKVLEFAKKQLSGEIVVKPNFATLKADFAQDMSQVIGLINKNKTEVVKAIVDKKTSLVLDTFTIDLTKHVLKEVKEQLKENQVEVLNGTLELDPKQTQDLLDEGFLREIQRRVQQLRKEIKLEKSQIIELCFVGTDAQLVSIIEKNSFTLCQKVGAKQLVKSHSGEVFENEIKGKKVAVSLKC